MKDVTRSFSHTNDKPNTDPPLGKKAQVIPTAAEMKSRVDEILGSKLEKIFERINKELHSVPRYRTTVRLSEDEEKFSSEIIGKLNELGYSVEYQAGFFEDRPCGGHVSAKIVIDWSRG